MRTDRKRRKTIRAAARQGSFYIVWDGLPIHIVACRYCEYLLPQPLWTIDHVVAQSRGGRNSQDNLVIACKQCNSKKRDYPICFECGGIESRSSFDQGSRTLIVTCLDCGTLRFTRQIRMHFGSNKKLRRKMLIALETCRRLLMAKQPAPQAGNGSSILPAGTTNGNGTHRE